MSPRPDRKHAHRIVWLMLGALCWAQWLAWTHVITHAPREDSQAKVIAVADQRADGGALLDGWNHAAGTPECQWIDQLLIGQTPSNDLSKLPSVDAGNVHLAALTHSAPAGPPRLAYRARGPPRG